ncbi:MAG TPA: zinc ribbon domain-containing protein [Candidatus Binatia bacterium]|jgi:putative FmdB family regulatory protein
MPIYEYKCQKCGTFETTQKITDRPLARCPTCKSKVKKLISNTSFQLKGTGWYITDYARKGQNGDAKSGNGSKSSSETKSEGSSTNKAQGSAESKSESKKIESSSSKSDKSSASSSTST